MDWCITGINRRFRTLAAAKAAAQERYARKLVWSAPTRDLLGIVVRGSTGVETDDKVTIHQLRRRY